MSPRLLGAAIGDPFDPHTMSGVSAHLMEALAQRYGPIDGIDASPERWQQVLAAASVFRLNREHWRQRYWRSEAGFRFMSRNADAAIRAVPGAFDLVFQIHALFRIRAAPYVVECDTTHQLNREGWPPWSPFSQREVRRWYALETGVYRGAEHVFARTPAVAASLAGFYGVPEEHVTVTGGGSHFTPEDDPPPRSREPVVLFVGREWERKGGPDLLEAWPAVRERFPGARLVVVGPPAQAPQPGVEFLGSVADRERIAELYRSTAVFCGPSRFEPYGLVFAEAMSFGLPCVGTTTIGIPSMVRDGETGLLVAPGDPVGLARALVRLLEDPELADAFGAAGRERVRTELQWEHVVGRMAPVLEALGADRARETVQI